MSQLGQLRFRDVTAKGVDEIFLGVSFGDGVAGANGRGSDAIGAQLVRQPLVGDFFASEGLGPGAVGTSVS